MKGQGAPCPICKLRLMVFGEDKITPTILEHMKEAHPNIWAIYYKDRPQ